MKDNGLLKYYKLQRIIGGRIDVSSIATKFYRAKNEKFGQCIIDGKKFFIKDKYPTKRGDSAEILLSQIYANAGFDTALYFPAVLPLNNKNCLLCQDICDSKTLSPGLFDYPLTSNQRVYSKEFFDMPKEEISNSIFYTKDAVRQIIKMHIFDLASNNADRNKSNYYLSLNEYNMVSGIKLFDYGFSAYYSPKLGFYNDFYMTDLKSKSDMIDFFKNSETISALVSVKDIAKELEQVDIKETCKDIEGQTGFKVDNNFAKEMQESFCQVSQQLLC